MDTDKISANWTLSDQYFKRCWNDAMATVTKIQKWFLLYGGICFVTLWALSQMLTWVSYPGFSVLHSIGLCGAVMVTLYFLRKVGWLLKMQRESDFQSRYQAHFSPNFVQVIGPDSEALLHWEAIQEVVPASHGIFLVLRRGENIYVPNESIADHKPEFVRLCKNVAKIK